MDEAFKLAEEIANGPTVAYKLMRKLYWDSLSNDFESGRHYKRIKKLGKLKDE